jgi:hypothetical protein
MNRTEGFKRVMKTSSVHGINKMCVKNDEAFV